MNNPVCSWELLVTLDINKDALGRLTGGRSAMVQVSLESRSFDLVIHNQRYTAEAPAEHFEVLGLGPPPSESEIREV